MRYISIEELMAMNRASPSFTYAAGNLSRNNTDNKVPAEHAKSSDRISCFLLTLFLCFIKIYMLCAKVKVQTIGVKISFGMKNSEKGRQNKDAPKPVICCSKYPKKKIIDRQHRENRDNSPLMY